MGLLDKLWDDVLAGPQPEKGLGRLRRPKLSLSIDDSAFDEDRNLIYQRRRSSEFQYAQDEACRVSQSIAIVKPPVMKATGLDEPLPSTPSDFSVTPSPSICSPLSRPRDCTWRSIFHSGGNKTYDRNLSAKLDDTNPNSPTVHDWVVISVLDR